MGFGALLLGLGWLLGPWMPAERNGGEGAAAAGAVPAVLAAAPQAAGTAAAPADDRPSPPVPAPAGAPPPPAVVPAAPAAAAPPDRRLPARLELCGAGTVRLPEAARGPGGSPDPFDALPPAVGRAALDAARERAWATLRAGDLRARVLERRWRELFEPPGAGSQAAAAALLREAQAGSDAAAARWASPWCQRGADGAACLRRLAAARVRAEPDNAAGWAAALAVAPPAEAEAVWRGLLEGRRWNDGFGEALAAGQPALPTALPAYLRLALGVELIGIDAATASDATPALARCRPAPGAQQAAAAAECDRVAALMVDTGDSALAVALGRRVGEWAGWPADRLAAAQALAQRLQAPAWQSPLLTAEQPLGCAATAAMQAHLDALARGGERAAAGLR